MDLQPTPERASSFDPSVVFPFIMSSQAPSGNNEPRAQQPAASSSGKPFPCPRCSKAYDTAGGLRYHTKVCDGGVQQSLNPFACPFDCDKRFKGLEGLRYHVIHGHQADVASVAALDAELAGKLIRCHKRDYDEAFSSPAILLSKRKASEEPADMPALKVPRKESNDSSGSDETRDTTSTLVTTSSEMIVESSKTAQARLEAEQAKQVEHVVEQSIVKELFGSFDSAVAVDQAVESTASPSASVAPEPQSIRQMSPPKRQKTIPAPILQGRSSPPPKPPTLYSGIIPIDAELLPIWMPTDEQLKRVQKTLRQAETQLPLKGKAAMLPWWEAQDDDRIVPPTPRRAFEPPQANAILSPRKARSRLRKNAYREIRAGESEPETSDEESLAPSTRANAEEPQSAEERWDLIADWRAFPLQPVLTHTGSGFSWNPPTAPRHVQGEAKREEWVELHECCWALRRQLPDRAEHGGPTLATQPPAPTAAAARPPRSFLGDPYA